MRKNRLYRVAVAFSPSIATHRAMARGVSRFAAARGDWLLSVVHTRPDALQSFPRLTAANFDGAIGDFTLPPFNTLITERPDLPLIVTDPDLIDKNARRTLRTAGSLMCNNKSIATAAADCLLARDAASYAYVNMLRPCHWSASRERTFIAAIRATGKTCRVYRSSEGITPGEDVAQLIAFLKALPKPAAALVACDARAQEVLAACRLARLAVPDDIAVLSVDNDESVCLHTTPTLSSIEQNSERGAYHAASVLDKAMRGGGKLTKRTDFLRFFKHSGTPFHRGTPSARHLNGTNLKPHCLSHCNARSTLNDTPSRQKAQHFTPYP